jgi:hypothetical protein
MTLLAPSPLIVNGRPRLGQFSDSLNVINHRDFVLETPFGKPASRLGQWLGFKQFQYFGGMSDTLVFGCALAHLRHMGVAFVYVVDMRTGELFSRSYRSPLGMGMTLSESPVEGQSHFQLPGVDIRMGYQGQPRQKTLVVRLGDRLEIDVVMPEAGFEPMSICTRTAYTGWVYANKTAGLALQGHLRFAGQTYDLASLDAMGHHDYSSGHMRRETYWNWACFSGKSRSGQRIGLNLSCGVNETSFTENCLWVDGRLIKVNLTRFDVDTKNLMSPWRISSDDGSVDLVFTPLGMHKEVLDLKIIASNFKQLFGRFDGCIKAEGTDMVIQNVSGFVEDQYVKW